MQGADRLVVSAPEEDVLGREARPERREHPEVTGCELAAPQEALQDEHHRDAGHVAAVAEYLAAERESAGFETEHLLEGVEHPGSPWVGDEVLDLVYRKPRRVAGDRE